MKRRINLCLFFLLTAVASMWAQDYYKPKSDRVTALETGKQYMIFNTAMADGTEDRTGFLYNAGTSLGHNKTKRADGYVYNSQFLFTLEAGETEGTYYIKSVSSGKYVNISGGTANSEGIGIYIAEWSAAKSEGTIAEGNFAGVGSYNDDGTTTANADITTANAVYIITTATDSGKDCWNGNANSFASWESGHPYAFYEVDVYEDADLMAAVEQYNAVAKSLDIYTLQQKCGLVQDASKWVCNYPSDPVDGAGYPGLVDGNAETHFHTGYSGRNAAPDGTKYYLQADLGYQVNAFNIYIQGRSGGGTKPAGFVIEGSNDRSSWTTIASSWTPTWNNNGCLSAAFATGGEGYRYIRFTHTSDSYFALGEFYIFPSNYVVDSYRSFLAVTVPVSGDADAIKESLSAIDCQNLMSFAGAQKPANGFKYYIYANTKYNGSYVPRYIYNTGADDAISVTTDLVENNVNYIWTCEVDADGYYYFKNSAGKYLAYNSGENKKFELVDSAYAFTLRDDANTKSAGAWSLYSNSASRYVVTETNGSSINQYLNKEGADASWCSDYIFIAAEGEQSTAFASGETYYISAYAKQSDGSYKNWYLYAADNGTLATGESNAGTLNYRWTITINSDGSYYMRNGNGKYLSYANKSLQLADAAYAFKLMDDATVKDAVENVYSLYNPTSSGGKYMVTSSTTASTWNQNSGAVNDTSWTSDYVFEKYTAPARPTVTINPYINGVGVATAAASIATIKYADKDYTGVCSFVYPAGADLPAAPVVTNPLFTFDGYYKDGVKVGETLDGEAVTADVTYEARYSFNIFTADLANPLPVRVYNNRYNDYVIRMNADGDGVYTGNAVNSGAGTYGENEIWYLVGTADEFLMYSRTAGNALSVKLAGTGSGSAATLAAEGTQLCLTLQSDGAFAINPVGATGQSFNMHGGKGNNIKLYNSTDGGSTWLFKRIDADNVLTLNYKAQTEGGYDLNYKIGEIAITIDGYTTTTMLEKGAIPASGTFYLPEDAKYALSTGLVCHGWTMNVNGSDAIAEQTIPDGGSTVNVNIAVDTDNKYQYLFYSPDENGKPFRIPAITTASDGTVLAFSDYRPCGSDIGYGEVDIMLRRSSDNGETWGDPIKIADGVGGDSNVFDVGFGDAAVVADRESGKVLVMAVAGMKIFYQGTADSHNFMAKITSSDNGASWDNPVDVTSKFFGTDALFPEAYTMFFGSGRLLQSKVVKVGNYYRIYGALLIKHPSSTYTGNCNYVVYSDDFGETWKILGGSVADGMCCNGGDEPKVEELADGTIILSSRKAPGRYFNVFTFTDLNSATGSWGTAVDSNFSGGLQIGNNACNGEILRIGNYLFQSLPYGPGRSNVKIYRKELEEGEEITPTYIATGWEEIKHVSTESSAYSTMTVLADNETIGFLFEEAPGDYSIVYLPIKIKDMLPADAYSDYYAQLNLPKLSIVSDDGDDSNDTYHYYRIVNTRKADTYVAYEGDNANMSLSNGDATERAKQLFYFTGEKSVAADGSTALKVKINNFMAGGNKLSNGGVFFKDKSVTGANTAWTTGAENPAGTSVTTAIPGTFLSASDTWTISFDVTSDGSSVNEWGAGLLSTQHSDGSNVTADALGTTYTGGFQLYLKKDNGGLDIKHNNSDGASASFTDITDFSSMNISLAYSPTGNKLTVTVTAGDVAETEEITCELNDVQSLYTAIPVGVNITNLKATRGSNSNYTVSEWNAEGDYWYITSASKFNNPGLAVVTPTADVANSGWNEFGGSGTQVGLWSGTDPGSHWKFEEVATFEEYITNETELEKNAFAELSADNPFYSNDRVVEINDMYSALAPNENSLEQLSARIERLAEIRAEWALETGLPLLTTADDIANNTIKWYAAKNIRNGNYATYAGPSVFMKESSEPVTASMFYFMEDGSVEDINGKPALKVKIYNYATMDVPANKVMAGINVWNETGSTYYIYSSAENHANPGLVISNKTDDSETAWSDYAGRGSDEIQNYKPSDGGSTWILSRIGNFAPVFDLDNRIDSLASSLNVTENCAAAFFVEGGNAGYTADEINDLKDTYPTGTYTECKATDTQLNTMKAAVDGLYKESMILYFNNLGNSSYWLGANIPNAVNATSNEAVHTNVWRIDHVGNGAYTMYNEAGNRYAGICPNNTGGSLAVPVNVDDAGKFVFVPQYTGEEITSYLIKSADVENAYLKLNSGNIYTVVSSNEISDFTRWTNRNMTDKIEISEALYTQAASIIWTQLPTINNDFGLVRLGSMLSSTDSTSIANLVDNNAATVFDSKDNATDYIQVDLGEGNGISSLFFYMRASGQEKRPTKVTVSASNNGTDFEPVGEQLTTALGYQLMHLSDRVSAGETYRYWRFTVDETNSGSADFVLSEFLVFKDVTYVSDFFTEANDFYETRFETLDAVKAAVDLLKVDSKYYIDRVANGIDNHDEYTEQDLGEYLTSAYEDFEDAYNNCYGSASTSTEIEETYNTLSEAQAVYLNSKNRPVFYVYNAYEDGYSNGVAVLYNGSDFDTDELSKWDYRQMFYDRNLNWAEFGNDDEGNVLTTTFERHLISYNGDKPLYNSSFTEFTPMSDWRVANGYTTDAAEERCAYNIDINNSHDGEDYLGIKGDGLNLDVYGAQCEKSDDAGYTNRNTAWYIAYVCQKKNLDRVKAVKEGEKNALDYMNEFYLAYKKLMNRMANVGDDFNEYKWTPEGGYDWSTLKGDSADYAQFLSISMVDLADGLEDGSYKISDITQKTIKVTEYVDDFELNIPQPGRYYRFAGMSKQRLPQDYYITGVAEMHNTARAGQQKTILMKPLYASDEVYEQNESTTIFYYGEHTTETGNNRTYLLSYDTGRFIGVKEHWIGEDMSKANNWNFEKVGEKRGNVAPVKFAASVVSYTSPAYSIRMGDDSQFKYLYAGGDYIDRGGNPTSDSEYYRYDWAVELVTELPLTITSAGFASYYVPVELQIPEGVRAFVLYESAVTDEESDFNLDNNEYFESGVSVFRLRQIKGDVIPAATPVILQAVAGTYRFKINYEPTLVTEEEKKDTYCYLDDITNLLEGTHEQNYIAERDGYTHYILANKSKGVGMYKVKTYESLTSDNPFGNGTITTEFETKSFLNREHRAWLPLQNTASLSGGVFSIERGGTTGIDDMDDENGTVKGIYDLQGRKIDEIIQPGIYIIDGKRVLVK